MGLVWRPYRFFICYYGVAGENGLNSSVSIRYHRSKTSWTPYEVDNRAGEKNWPIADRCVTGNYPRNNCGTHFGSSSLVISKEANRRSSNVNGILRAQFRLLQST